MELDDEDREELRRELVNDSCRSSRRQYLSTSVELLINIEDWLAIDSWLGGGKLQAPVRTEHADLTTFSAFRAVATVVSMSTELAEAAIVMVEKRRVYAVGALIRQLIECEYLLTLFGEDLEHARRWSESTPAEIRSIFSPQKMRNRLGKFLNEEYWHHCDSGGHPAPSGVELLQKLDPDRQVWPFKSEEISIDLGLHIRRIWRATDNLLSTHHARYETVRSDQRKEAEEAWLTWRNSDPFVDALTDAFSSAIDENLHDSDE